MKHAQTQSLARLLLLLLLLLLPACGSAPGSQARASLSAVGALSNDSSAAFARATAPRPFVFPQDHGPHPAYQLEWWYFTGNLADQHGRRFGYQLTFFRSGLTPEPQQRDSDWAASSIYMAHLALSDIASGQFYHFERFSRGAAGLAGATGDPFRVFLEDWSAVGSGPQGMTIRLQAAEQPIALDLLLDSARPPVLQGDQGYSRKGEEPGNASYYYSLSRMETAGTIRVQGQRHAVTGLSWMDHEFGTSALEAGAVGWDWFSIQLDDGRDIMFASVRGSDGQPLFRFGTLVAADGSARSLPAETVQLAVLDSWRSPHSGAVYPAGWRLHLPGEGLTLQIEPLLADQEWTSSVVYWEGAVRISGTQQGAPVAGYGYVELTGYADAQQGRY